MIKIKKKIKKFIKYNIFRPIKRRVKKLKIFFEIDFEQFLIIAQLSKIKLWVRAKIQEKWDYMFNIGALLGILIYYYPFYIYINYEIGFYFRGLDRLLATGLFAYFFKYEYLKTILILTVLGIIERYIYLINKKRNVKSTYNDRYKYSPQIYERIFVFLNYFIFWVVLSGSHIKLTKEILIKFFPKSKYRSFLFYGILIKWLLGITKIPGNSRGITGIVSLYITYVLIVRNHKIFPYFIRYHFMAAQLSTVLMDLIDTICIYFLKYYRYINPRHYKRYKLLLQYNTYIIYSFYIFCCMIFSIFGFLIPNNFLNSAIFWHVGVDKRL